MYLKALMWCLVVTVDVTPPDPQKDLGAVQVSGSGFRVQGSGICV